jgi:preprotein translocase subunit YajC
MLSSLWPLFADGSAPAGTPAAGQGQPPSLGDQLTPFVMITAMVAIFYFIFWRPMQRERKKREGLLSQIKKNDDVILNSGIYGTVVGVAEDKDEITVKIADNTRVRVIKSAIARNLTNEEALKAQDGKAAPTPPKTEGNT